jgi:hypothetical protein
MRKLAISFTLLTLASCAKSTNEIPAQYISPMQYQAHSCELCDQYGCH